MPIRIPTCRVIVQRNGKNFAPPINKPFEFEADEIKDLNATAPFALRKPVNESAEAVSEAPAASTPVAASSSTRGTGKKGSTPAASNTDTEL